MSSDELIDYYGTADEPNYQFNINNLQTNNGDLTNFFWTPAYQYIYGANAAIAGLAASTGISDSAKMELTGEAEFIRALCYFYLTNLFQNVPLVLTTDFSQTATLAGATQTDIYKQIVQDLLSAQKNLPADYSVGQGQRIRPNKWAATALLARTYLYMYDYADAYTQSSAVISNTNLFSLVPLANVFSANSNEAIWQLQQNSGVFFSFNGTVEGIDFVPDGLGDPPSFYLSSQLVDSFETGDQRWANWVGADSVDLPGFTFYYPNKYTLGFSQVVQSGSIPQYYMVLRLAEQYLIRAEAEANGTNGGTAAAITDLNTIRARAGGIAPLSTSLTAAQTLGAVAHERQIELFAEWGHRWLDLKRTNQAVSVLSQVPLHQAINQNMLLYPIPYQETVTDPNLKQNTGY